MPTYTVSLNLYTVAVLKKGGIQKYEKITPASASSKDHTSNNNNKAV